MNFQCNLLYHTTKQHLNSEKRDVELRHLSAFGQAMLFSCPVLGRILFRALDMIVVYIIYILIPI